MTPPRSQVVIPQKGPNKLGNKPERTKETVHGEMRYRPLGRTGEEVSVIGLGGHHIGRQKEEKESIKIIRAAISFEQHVLPVLVEEGIGVLGMKPMGDSLILASKTATPVECLHYAMNLPTSTVITGIDSMEILKQALEAVKTFRSLTENQKAGLLARTAQAASRGKFEGFKTTNGFDGTAQNPTWLGEPDQGPA